MLFKLLVLIKMAAETLREKGIALLTPSDDAYLSTLQSFAGVSAKPAIVCLPESAAQVALIVQECIAAGWPIVVRGGGHDIHGRSAVDGTVSIDLRKLDSVTLSGDKKTATVGGGVKSQRVLDELQKHGLQACVGSCGTVGFVGWSVIGGFGPYSESYGIGNHQIVGARVVNARGEIVDADKDMLKGLRGGGGCLGVVTDLTVKVHPAHGVQAGMLNYDSADVGAAVAAWFTNFAKLPALPSQLSVMPFVLPIGEAVRVTCVLVWNGPASDESRAWVDRIAGLAPSSGAQAIASTTAADFLRHVTSFLPEVATGPTETASAETLTPEMVSVLAECAGKMTTAEALNVIMVRGGPSCSGDAPEGVTPFTKPIVIFELIGYGRTEGASWATGARKAVIAAKGASKRLYLPLCAPESINLDDIYGEKVGELRRLKEKYDPDRVFKYTLPRV